MIHACSGEIVAALFFVLLAFNFGIQEGRSKKGG